MTANNKKIKERSIEILIYFNLLIFVIYLYSPALSNGYIWDDLDFYIHQQINAKSILELFSSQLLSVSHFYRPVGTLLFFCEQSITSSPTPIISHLINILLHALNCLLLIIILRDHLKQSSQINKIIYIGSVTLFAAFHLSAIEPTVWVSARFELFCLTMILLTHLLATAKKVNFFTLSMMAATLLLALLSKEMALSYIVALPFFLIQRATTFNVKDYILDKAVIRDTIIRLAPAALATLVWFILRSNANIPTPNTGTVFTLSEHLSLIAQSLKLYLVMLVNPALEYKPYWAFDENTLKLSVVSSLALLVIPLALTAIGFYYKNRSNLVANAAQTILLYIVCLIPVLNLIPIFPNFFFGAARYAYIPLFIAIIYFTQACYSSKSNLPRLTIAVSILCSIFTIISATQLINSIGHYNNQKTFWSWVIQTNGSNHPHVISNYFDALTALGEHQEALDYFQANNKNYSYQENFQLLYLATRYKTGESTTLDMGKLDDLLKSFKRNPKGISHLIVPALNLKAKLMVYLKPGEIDRALETVNQALILKVTPYVLSTKAALLKLKDKDEEAHRLLNKAKLMAEDYQLEEIENSYKMIIDRFESKALR